MRHEITQLLKTSVPPSATKHLPSVHIYYELSPQGGNVKKLQAAAERSVSAGDAPSTLQINVLTHSLSNIISDHCTLQNGQGIQLQSKHEVSASKRSLTT